MTYTLVMLTELVRALSPLQLLCISMHNIEMRAQPGTGWTPAKFNSILHDHIVAGELITFGCVEWQSQLFLGVMYHAARCYPFDMPKKRFHGFNPKV